MNETNPQRMGTGEFVALIAMLFSTVAFSIDALLPAFPQIETDLQSDGSTHLVLTVFMAGLAMGTLLFGPLSDDLGRKRAMYIGAAIYMLSGLVCWMSESFEVIVIMRFLQGVGAAGPRVVSLAIVRDLYSGRQMARIMSFAMVLFTIVPALAPAMGNLIAGFYGWRAILLILVLFSLVSTLWIWLRLNEPLLASRRIPFRIPHMLTSAKEVLSHRTVRLAILTQGIALGLVFSMITQVQPIFDHVFNRAETFAYWFGGIALISAASTSLVNASLVMRFGMRSLVTLSMFGHLVNTALALCLMAFWPDLSFPTFVVWQFVLIWLAGTSVGNLNALAMEPMGHIAGITASLIGGISTLIASGLAAVVGYSFDGTPFPLLLSALIMAFVGVLIMLRMTALDITRA